MNDFDELVLQAVRGQLQPGEHIVHAGTAINYGGASGVQEQPCVLASSPARLFVLAAGIDPSTGSLRSPVQLYDIVEYATSSLAGVSASQSGRVLLLRTARGDRRYDVRRQIGTSAGAGPSTQALFFAQFPDWLAHQYRTQFATARQASAIQTQQPALSAQSPAGTKGPAKGGKRLLQIIAVVAAVSSIPPGYLGYRQLVHATDSAEMVALITKRLPENDVELEMLLAHKCTGSDDAKIVSRCELHLREDGARAAPLKMLDRIESDRKERKHYEETEHDERSAMAGWFAVSGVLLIGAVGLLAVARKRARG